MGNIWRPEERGFVWVLVSTGSNTGTRQIAPLRGVNPARLSCLTTPGSALLPLLAVLVSSAFGVVSVFLFSGILNLAMAFLFWVTTSGLPLMAHGAGLPAQYEVLSGSRTLRHCHSQSHSHSLSDSLDWQKPPSVSYILRHYILSTPSLLLVCLAYLFAYIVRTSLSDWTALYLMTSKCTDSLTDFLQGK